MTLSILNWSVGLLMASFLTLAPSGQSNPIGENQTTKAAAVISEENNRTDISKLDKPAQGSMVAFHGPNNWQILDPETEFDCNGPGNICTGTLKEGAEPNEDGSYNTSEVDYSPSSGGFRLL